jgi:hypothetical protein
MVTGAVAPVNGTHDVLTKADTMSRSRYYIAVCEVYSVHAYLDILLIYKAAV